MARRDASTKKETNNSNFKKADAFLRLEVVDSAGNKHKLPKDLAMYLSNHVQASMIKAAEDKPEVEFKLVGSIHIVSDEPKADIKF